MSEKKLINDFIKDKARAEKHAASKEFEQAKTRIDSKYLDFLVLLSQHVNLSKKVYELDQDAKSLGIWIWDERGTYVTINKPYITVDGRIKMARDEHKEANKKLDVHPPQIIEVAGKTLLSVQIDSELYGQATGTIEVGVEGRGVDAFNPFANAQTSAIGRALGFLGYGLIGTGTVASAEEMEPLTDQEVTPSHPTTTSTEGQNSTPPKLYRVQVKGLPNFNRDGSSYFKVLTEEKKTITVIMPKEHRAYMENLGVNQILNVSGWINANGNLRVNAKVNPEIEMPAA